MTRRARRVDAHDERVAVAVVADLLDASTFPDVSPLRHSRSRDRLQNHASPVSRVSRSASSSIQASMSTRPSRASCTIAA